MRSFYEPLLHSLQKAEMQFATIPQARKEDLSKVADYVGQCLVQSGQAKLVFLCTHNSRRSHLAQIWAQVAAEYYGIQGVQTYSGGTEATAFHPNAIAALVRHGLKVVAQGLQATNPIYEVTTSEKSVPMLCFSKVYDAAPNPREDFGAVMTCSEADNACPMVAGCDLRVPIRYEDPKIADGTEWETQRYDERCAQICTEMLYMNALVRAFLDDRVS